MKYRLHMDKSIGKLNWNKILFLVILNRNFWLFALCSPNYPDFYPRKKDCIWHFSTTPGHRIRLHFTAFEMEPHQVIEVLHCLIYSYQKNLVLAQIIILQIYFNLKFKECAYDHVAIYNGDSTESFTLGKFCGSKLPHPISASSNEMFMVFKSDASIQRHGFAATHSTGTLFYLFFIFH